MKVDYVFRIFESEEAEIVGGVFFTNFVKGIVVGECRIDLSTSDSVRQGTDSCSSVDRVEALVRAIGFGVEDVEELH